MGDVRSSVSTSPNRPVPFGVVSRLTQFKKELKLKRTALLAVSFALGRDQLEALSRQFNKIDTDKVQHDMRSSLSDRSTWVDFGQVSVQLRLCLIALTCSHSLARPCAGWGAFLL
jgi:hypothetical protein